MKKFILALLAFVPIIGFAGICDSNNSTPGIAAVSILVNNISKFILKPLIFLMFGLATLVFIWGVQGFVGSADDAEARSKGAQQMIWGIVGMVIMIGAVALTTIICNTAQTL